MFVIPRPGLRHYRKSFRTDLFPYEDVADAESNLDTGSYCPIIETLAILTVAKRSIEAFDFDHKTNAEMWNGKQQATKRKASR